MFRAAIAVIVTVLWAASIGTAYGATPTVVPPATETAAASPVGSSTEEPAAVAAPTNVQIDLAARRISWQDNSTEETGYRIIYTVEGLTTVSATYTVGPNITVFNIPADAPVPVISCGYTITVSVAALRGSVTSAPDVNGVAADCAPPTAVPQSLQLPGTGASDQSAARRVATALVAVVMFVAGVSLLWAGRSRRSM